MLSLLFFILGFVTSITQCEPTSPDFIDTTDLVALMQRPKLHQPEIYTNALRLVDALETAPSCSRLAAASLIDSCQSLESSKSRDAALALEQLKSKFAARLAVCELMGAHASVPPACRSVVALQDRTKSKKFQCFFPGSSCQRGGNKAAFPTIGYEDDKPHGLGDCLAALEGRPQSWTSYSNARQNAVIMCQAVRLDLEKGKLDGSTRVERG